MLKFAFYISNHGYGHASRISALAESMISFGVYCHIVTEKPSFLFGNLDQRFSKLHHRKIDTGVRHGANLQTDLTGTIKGIMETLSNRNDIVAKEVDFIREFNIDLIIADAPYLVVDVSKYSGVPVFAISNFDWYFIYSNLLERHPQYLPVLNNIWSMYQSVDYSFRLPFSTNDSVQAFPNPDTCGLLARKKSIYNNIRKPLSIDSAARILLVMFGGEGNLELNYESLCHAWDGIVISTQGDVQAQNHRKVEVSDDFLDLMYNSDVVLCKPGYSTFAEAVQFGKYIMYSPRGGYPEELALLDGIRKYRNSCLIPNLNMNTKEWKAVFKSIKLSHGKQKTFVNQNEQIASQILAKYIEIKYKHNEMMSVFDIGSNSMNYVLYNLSLDKPIHITHCTTGLGRDVKGDAIPAKNLARTMKAIAPIIVIDSRIKSSKHATGTGVLRNVNNADKLISFLKKKHSLALNVISAEDEAKYVYYAAMPCGNRGEACVAIDLGGASTEFASFGKGKRSQLTSIPIGLLKLLKECSNSLAVAEVTIARYLEIMPSVKADKVIGVGLTYTYLAKALYKDIYASDINLHGKVISKPALLELLETFNCEKEHEYIPFLVSEDYLPILRLSAMFLISVLDKFQCNELIVCSYGISSGYARSSIMKSQKKGRKN
jgi:hypothetical protein